MCVAVQDSLLDFGDEPTPTALRPERVPLSHGAWVDLQRGWLAGSASLFGRLVEEVPWKAERRRMYDRTVDVPRLLCFYGENAALPDPALDACRDALNAHYQAELGERLPPRGCASTGTGETASPCTATRSGAARARTPWSRSCPWERRGRWCCARVTASRRRCGTTSGTGISS